MVCAALCFPCIGATMIAALSRTSFADTLSKGYGETTSSMRLIAAPQRHGGHYDAAVAITMSKGSHTYWKQPGEAGVPPVFTFNGSENVTKAEVEFPAPSRITEEGLTAYGYTDSVTFPVVVTPADPSKPAVLHADVTYAVCNKICVPAHGEGTLTLPPRGEDSAAATVAAAIAAVPKPASEAQRRDLAITPQKGTAKPTWTLAWHGNAPVSDIFADAPQGFFFTTRKNAGNDWTLVADQTVPGDLAKHVPVSLTLKRGDDSLIATQPLDASAPAK